MVHDLTRFSLADMTRCGIDLRKLGKGAASMEEVGERVVRYLHTQFEADGVRSCALVRLYKTHPFGELGGELQDFARNVLSGADIDSAVKCLTLLATAGDEPQWNDRHLSRGHRAIPLPSEQIVARFPMIAQLVTQFGLDVSNVVKPDPAVLVDLDQRTYNVFHVAEAAGSPFIPAQDFVEEFGIRSALGFGGMFPSGHLFAVVMFTKISIPPETADLFESLALSAKMAMLPFEGTRTFRLSSVNSAQ